MIQLSFWRPDRPLIDPFCGSGTIPIEAAMIGRNLAPGLGRAFAAGAWPRQGGLFTPGGQEPAERKVVCDAAVRADAHKGESFAHGHQEQTAMACAVTDHGNVRIRRQKLGEQRLVVGREHAH